MLRASLSISAGVNDLKKAPESPRRLKKHNSDAFALVKSEPLIASMTHPLWLVKDTPDQHSHL